MPKGKLPTYKGKVCDENRNELGSIAIWEQSKEERKSEKSPVLRGEIEIETAKIKVLNSFDEPKMKIRVAVWLNTPKGGVSPVQ